MMNDEIRTADHRLLIACENTLRDYMPKIREAVERLTDEQIWQRPNEASNSIGNMLLHLSGNVRQYLISGAGGVPDVRNRPAEFAAKEGQNKHELLSLLEQTVAEACAVLESLDPAVLLEERTIQNRKLALMNAIFHSTEHFAYHAGQIIFVSKALTQQGYDWWKHLD
jgi:uncharacterized damage-inducible protein DinB